MFARRLHSRKEEIGTWSARLFGFGDTKPAKGGGLLGRAARRGRAIRKGIEGRLFPRGMPGGPALGLQKLVGILRALVRRRVLFVSFVSFWIQTETAFEHGEHLVREFGAGFRRVPAVHRHFQVSFQAQLIRDLVFQLEHDLCLLSVRFL